MPKQEFRLEAMKIYDKMRHSWDIVGCLADSLEELVEKTQFKEYELYIHDDAKPAIHMSADVVGVAGRYPRASDAEKALGYTLSADFIERVAKEAWHSEPDAAAYSDDKVEFILLKAEEILSEHPMSAEVEKAVENVEHQISIWDGIDAGAYANEYWSSVKIVISALKARG
jgi:hypothetical protein